MYTTFPSTLFVYTSYTRHSLSNEAMSVKRDIIINYAIYLKRYHLIYLHK